MAGGSSGNRPHGPLIVVAAELGVPRITLGGGSEQSVRSGL